jgi:N6-adenosine-specific RNA methylase IME4
MTGQLVKYDAMCKAIAEAHRVDEVKDIRDKALAIQAYARQAKNREVERQAEQIRLRAERKAGELLRAMKAAGKMAKGGSPYHAVNSTGYKAEPVEGSLDSWKITKKQSFDWQRVAAIPLEDFTRAVERPHPGPAVRSIVKRVRRSEREEELAEATAKASKQIGTDLYAVIMADPPWRFEPYSREGMDRAADNHYPTVTLAEIKALKVPAADDCVLFLWATVPMLPQALDVMTAWGFVYRSHFIWLKDRIGTGYWSRNKHELLLVGTRGNIPAPAAGEQFESVISAPLGKHSAKPNAFAEMIEEMFPNCRAIEMFARGPRLGWDVFGNEAL